MYDLTILGGGAAGRRLCAPRQTARFSGNLRGHRQASGWHTQQLSGQVEEEVSAGAEAVGSLSAGLPCRPGARCAME